MVMLQLQMPLYILVQLLIARLIMPPKPSHAPSKQPCALPCPVLLLSPVTVERLPHYQRLHRTHL